ncbi:hypothetical protein BDR26DRAFT_319323 [Obelidium mucronatum]|nr:hypothetical protein BDR26DRAFT_319323 [Obelidium mucronatum]
MQLNEEDHAADISNISLLKKDLLAAQATIAHLEAKINTTAGHLKDEQDAHFETAHKLALSEATAARLELENKQSNQNMKAYMKYSEEQQHLLISHIERMQTFSNRRMDNAAGVLSKTHHQFIATLEAMKDMSTIIWISSAEDATISQKSKEPSQEPEAAKKLFEIETKLDGIRDSVKCILSTMISNTTSTEIQENSLPMTQLLKRNANSLHASNSLLFYGTSDNNGPVENAPVVSFMKRIGSTLGLTPDVIPPADYISIRSGKMPSRTASPQRQRLEHTDSDIVMDSLSDLEDDRDGVTDGDKVQTPPNISSTSLPTGTPTNASHSHAIPGTELKAVITRIKAAKLSKLVQVINAKDDEISLLSKEVETLKGVLMNVAGNVESSEANQEKKTANPDDFSLSLEWKANTLSLEKKELHTKLETLQARVTALQQVGLKLKSDLDAKSISLERAEQSHEETISQLKQTQMKLEATEAQYSAIQEQSHQMKLESDQLKKRMASILKKIEGKTLEIVSLQLNNEASTTSDSFASPKTPNLSTSPLSFLSPTSTSTEMQVATRYLAEKESEVSHLRTHIEKLNLRVTDSFHRIRDLESKLLASSCEVERLKAVEDLCGQLEVECDRWRNSATASAKRAKELEQSGGERKKSNAIAPKPLEKNPEGDDLKILKASLVRATLESESIIERLNRDKKRLHENIESLETEVEQLRNRVNADQLVLSTKDIQIQELERLLSAVQQQQQQHQMIASSPLGNDAVSLANDGSESFKIVADERFAALKQLERCRLDLETARNKIMSLESAIELLQSQNVHLNKDRGLPVVCVSPSDRPVDKKVAVPVGSAAQQSCQRCIDTSGLMRDLSDCQSKIASFEDRCKKDCFRIGELENVLNALQREKSSLVTELDGRLKDLSVLHSKTLAHQATINSLEQAVSERDRKLRALENQSDSLLAEKIASLEDLALKSSQLHSIQNQFEAYQTDLSKRSTDVVHLITQGSEQQQEIRRLENLLEERNRRVISLSTAFEAAEQDKSLIQGNFQTLEIDKRALEEELKNKVKDLNTTQIQLVSQEKLVSEKTSRIEKLVQQISEYQKSNERLEKSLKEVTVKYQLAESVIKELKENKESLEASLRKEQKEKMASLEELSQKGICLNATQEEVAAHQKLIAEKTLRIDELSMQLSRHLFSIKSLESSLTEKDSRLKGIEASMEVLQKEKGSLESLLDAELDEKFKLQKKSTSLSQSMEEAIAAKSSDLDKLSREMQRLSSERDSISKELAIKADGLNSLQNRLAKTEKELSAKNVKIADLNGEVTVQREAIISLERSVACKAAELARLEDNLTLQVSQNNAVTTKLDEKLKEIKFLEQKIGSFQVEVGTLNSAVVEKDKANALLHTRMTQLASDRDHVSSELSKASARVANLQNEVNTMKETCSQAQMETTLYHDKLDACQGLNQSLERKLEETQGNFSALEISFKSLAAEKTALLQMLSQNNVVVDDKLKQVAILEQKVDTHQADVKSLKSAIVEKDQVIMLLQDRVAQMVLERDSLSNEVSKASALIINLRDEVKTTKEMCLQAQTQSNMYHDKLDASYSLNQSLERKLEETQGHSMALEMSLKNLVAEKASLSEQVSQMSKEAQCLVDNLNSVNAVVVEKSEQCLSLTRDLASRDQQLVSSETEVSRLKNAVTLLSSEKLRLLEDAKTENALHVDAISGKENEIRKLQQELLEKTSHLQDLDRRVLSLTTKKDLLMDEIVAKVQENDELHAELLSVRNKMSESIRTKDSQLSDQASLLSDLEASLLKKQRMTDQLSIDISLAEASVTEKALQCATLMQNISSLEEHKLATDKKAEELNQLVESMLCEKQSLLSDSERFQSEIATLLAKVSGDQTTINTLQTAITEKDAILSSLDNRIVSLTAKKLELTETLAAAIQENESLSSELSSFRIAASSSNNKKDAQISFQLASISDLERIVFEKESKVKALEESFSKLLSEKESSAKLLDTLRQDYAVCTTLLKEKNIEEPLLRDQILRLQTASNEKDANIKNYQREVESLEDKLNTLNIELSNTNLNAKVELSSQAIRLAAKEAECEDLSVKLQTQSVEIDRLTDSLNAKTNLLQEKFITHAALETRIKEKESELAACKLDLYRIGEENQTIMEVVEKLKEDGRKSDALITTLRGEHDLLLSRIASQNSEILVLKDAFKEASCAYAKLASGHEDARDSAPLRMDEPLKCQDKDRDVDMQAQTSYNPDMLDLQTQNLAAANALIENLRTELVKSEAIVFGLKEESARLLGVCEGVEQSREILRASLREKTEEFKVAKDENLELERVLTICQTEKEEFRQSNNINCEKLQQLGNDYDQLQQVLASMKLQLEDKVEQVQNAIKERNAIVEANEARILQMKLLVQENEAEKAHANDLTRITENNLQSSIAEKRTLESRVEVVQNECETLKLEMKRISESCSIKASEIEKAETINSLLEGKCLRMEAELETSWKELASTRQERDQLKLDVGQLSAICKSSESAAAEYSNFSVLLEEKSAEVLRLRKCLDEKSLELESLFTSFENSSSENENAKSRLMETIQSLEIELAKFKSDNYLLVAENEQFMTILTTYKLERLKIQEQATFLGSRVSFLEAELLETTNRLSSLSIELKSKGVELANQTERSHTLSTAVTDLTMENDEWKAKRKELQDLIVSLELKVSSAEERALASNAELDFSRNSLVSLTKQYETVCNDLAESRKRCSDLLQRLNKLDSELDEANQVRLQICSERDQLKQDVMRIEEMSKEISHLRLTSATVSKSLDDKTSELNDVRQVLKKNNSNADHQTIEKLNAVVDAMRSQLSGLEENNKELLEVSKSKAAECIRLKSKLADLETKTLEDLTQALKKLEKGEDVTEFVTENRGINLLIFGIVVASKRQLDERIAAMADQGTILRHELANALQIEGLDLRYCIQEAGRMTQRLKLLEKTIDTSTDKEKKSLEQKEEIIQERGKSLRLSQKLAQLESTTDQLTSEWQIKVQKLESKTLLLQSQLSQKIEEAKSLEEQLVFELDNRRQASMVAQPVLKIDNNSNQNKPSVRSFGTQFVSCETSDASTGMSILLRNCGVQTMGLPIDVTHSRMNTEQTPIFTSNQIESSVVSNLVAEVSYSQSRIKALEDELNHLKDDKQALTDTIESQNQKASRIIKELDTERLFRDVVESETFSLRDRLLEMQQLKDAEVNSRYSIDTISTLILVFQEVVNAQYSLTSYMEAKLLAVTSENKDLRSIQSKYDLLLKEAEKLHAACDNWSQSYNELRLECNDTLDERMGEISDLKGIIIRRNSEIEELLESNRLLAESLDLVKESDDLHKAKCSELKLIISESESSNTAKCKSLLDDISHWKRESETFELKFAESEKRIIQLSKEWDESFLHLRSLAAKEKETLVAEHSNAVSKLEERLENELLEAAALSKELISIRAERDGLQATLNSTEQMLVQARKLQGDKIGQLQKSLEKEALALRLEKKKSESLHTIIQSDREKCSRLETQVEEYQLRIQTLTESLTVTTTSEQMAKKQVTSVGLEVETWRNEVALLKRQLEHREKRYVESEAYLRKKLTESRDEYLQKEMQWASDQRRLEQHNDSLSENCEISITEFHQLSKEKHELETQVQVLSDSLALKTAEWTALEAELNDQLVAERASSEERNVQLTRIHSDGENNQIEQIRRMSLLEKENTSLTEKLTEMLANELQLKRQLVILETELRTTALEWEQDRKSLEEEAATVRVVSQQQIEEMQNSMDVSYQQFQAKENQWLLLEREFQYRFSSLSNKFEQTSAEVSQLTDDNYALEYALSDSNSRRNALESQLVHLEKMLHIDQNNVHRLVVENGDLRFQLSATNDYIKTLERHAATMQSPQRNSSLMLNSVEEIRNTAQALLVRKSSNSVGTQTSRTTVNRSSMTTSDLLASYQPPSLLEGLAKVEATDTGVNRSKQHQTKSVTFADMATEGHSEYIEEEERSETIIYYEESAKRGNIERINREIENIQAKYDQSKHKTMEAIDSYYNQHSPTEDKDIDFIKAATKRSVVGTGATVQIVMNRKHDARTHHTNQPSP